MNVSIIVATHKKYDMPKDDMYIPLYVGACRDNAADYAEPSGHYHSNIPETYKRDDEGENISKLNPSFCELTGLYWAYKNLDADYIGLVQYRRHFRYKKNVAEIDDVLGKKELKNFIPEKKVFLPIKRKYYIETLYSHYAHTHFAVQLDAAKEMIEKIYPEYVDACEQVFKMRSGYMFNMFIMTKELFDDYCKWLFDILFALKDELGAKAIKLEKDEDTEDEQPLLSDFQARFYGRVSEILFNVWLCHHLKQGVIKNEDIMELGFVNLEGENMGKRVTSFLKAKFFGKKYDESF